MRRRTLPFGLRFAGLAAVIFCLGCPGFPSLPDLFPDGGFPGTGPGSVQGATPDDPDGSGQDLPDLDAGPVRVEVINPTGHPARFTLRMFVLAREVHFAERDLPGGDTEVVIGPDAAERIEIAADFTDLADDAPQTGTFRFGQEFAAGDIIRFVLAAPEPNEPNEPNDGTGNPDPLLVETVLASDLTLEAGEPADFSVSLIGQQPGATLSVFADPDATPASGNELSVATNLAAQAENAIRWDTTGVPPGTYRLYAEATDDPRFDRSDYAVGVVTIIALASVQVADLVELVEVDAGAAVPFRVLTVDALSNATLTALADPDQTPASGGELVIAADVAAGASVPIAWDTTGVAPGDYRVYADLDNGGRLKRSPYAPGLVRVLAALNLSFIGLEADVAADIGDTIDFSVLSANGRDGATLDVSAIPVAGGASIPIVTNLPAANLTAVAWDTTGVAAGEYRIVAELRDGARELVAEADGRVTLAVPLVFELTTPGSDLLVEFGEEVNVAGRLQGAPPAELVTIFARQVDDPNDVRRLGRAVATPEFETSFEVNENLSTGTYELFAVLDPNGVGLESAPAPGLLTVVSPLFVQIVSLPEPVLLERGESLEVVVQAFGNGDEGVLALLAAPSDPNHADPNIPDVPDPNAENNFLIAFDVAASSETLIEWNTTDTPPGTYRLFAILDDGPRRRVSAFAPAAVRVAPALAVRITDLAPHAQFPVNSLVPFTVEVDRAQLGGLVTVYATPPGADPNNELAFGITEFEPLPSRPVTWNTVEVAAGAYDLIAVLESGDGRRRVSAPIPIELITGLDCSGDANGDLVVDLDDLLIVLENFNTTEPEPAGDVTGDGQVNLDDLLLVLQSFGNNCSP